MTHLDRAKALREDKEVHYNCFQATVLPFCEEYGLDADAAMRAGTFLNAGVRHGSVCGAVAGAMAVLGLAEADNRRGLELLRRFREKNGSLTCAELLKAAAERGEEKKPHCDRMVYDAVRMAEELLRERDGETGGEG